tara:strand:- start:3327 stop:3701 length:375 start_codon:yes stop_codon:yes gene_type:complete
MKILIVDDEPDVVAGLARNLQLADFDVATAPDGREAVAKCRNWKPDALLMDIRMPHLNGMEACREIQREQPEILVILMTGFSEALDEANQHIFARACENQQVELMMKPIDLDEVIALIRSGEMR